MGMRFTDTFRLLQLTWSEQKEVDFWYKEIFVFVDEPYVETRHKNPLGSWISS